MVMLPQFVIYRTDLSQYLNCLRNEHKFEWCWVDDEPLKLVKGAVDLLFDACVNGVGPYDVTEIMESISIDVMMVFPVNFDDDELLLNIDDAIMFRRWGTQK